MSELYRKLRDIRLPTPYVKSALLPDWWDDDAARSPAGFSEAVWIIARHLGVDPAQLRDADRPLRLPENRRVFYKRREDVRPESLALARLLSEQVTRFVMLGAAPRARVDCDASVIRRDILEKGASCVGFGDLLDFCWSAGVPVIHVSHLPKGTPKMEGMALSIGDRPAIVLTGRRQHSAWMLFPLAHELGHICSGHVADGSGIVDADIDTESDDPKEKEANDFALTTITGKAGTRIMPAGRWPNAKALAEGARLLGEQRGIDPGHIVLNYAHSMGSDFWGVANAALKLIPSEGDPLAMIRERMSANLDWSNLPSEAAEFVARMTGLGAAAKP